MGVGSDDECPDETKAGRRGRRRRWAAGGAVGLILLAAVGLATLNVLLNLSWAKQKIERKADQLVGAPLKIAHILVMPWGAVRLIDIRMVIPEAAKIREGFPPLVSCGEIRISVDPLSLLMGSIRLRSIEVIDPALSVVRSSNRGLILPKRAGEKDLKLENWTSDPGGLGTSTPPQGASPMIVMPSTATDGIVSGESLLAEASADEGMQKEELPKGNSVKEEEPTDRGAVDGKGKSIEPPKDKVVPTKEMSHLVIRFRGHDVHLGELILRRGLLQVTSLEKGEVLMKVEGLEMAVNVGSDVLKPGNITATRVTLFDAIEVNGFRGEVALNGFWIDFLNIMADVEGGRVEGKVRASPFFVGVPFIAVIEARDIAAGEIVSRILPDIAIEGGALKSELKVIGRLRDPSSYRGVGEIKLAGARLGKNRILEALSKVADVTALMDVAVDDIYAKVRLDGKNIAIEDMRASSQDITLAGRGNVGTQGWLQVALRLYLNDRAYSGVRAIEKHLPEGTGMGFIPYEGSIERYFRDYLITGTAEAPSINFWAPDEEVSVAELKEQFIRLLGSASKGHLPGSTE